MQQKNNDFKEVQQDLTELNGDGNRERGRYGEDLVGSHIANLKGIPVREDLDKLLEQNVLVVDFTKLNGDKRVMTCTLREDMKPPATKTDTMSQKKVRAMTDAVVSVWDVNAKGWRSFRYERVNKVDVVDEYLQEWYNKPVDNLQD